MTCVRTWAATAAIAFYASGTWAHAETTTLTGAAAVQAIVGSTIVIDRRNDLVATFIAPDHTLEIVENGKRQTDGRWSIKDGQFCIEHGACAAFIPYPDTDYPGPGVSGQMISSDAGTSISIHQRQ